MPIIDLSTDQEPVRAEALRSMARGFGRRIAAFAAIGHRRWRRSLQLRIVAYTLIASSILVSIFGVVVATRIQDGLLQSRIEASISQLNNGHSYVEDQLGAFNRADDYDLPRSMQAVAENLAQLYGSGGESGVVILGGGALRGLGPATAGLGGSQQLISDELEARVLDNQIAHQFVTLPPTTDPQGNRIAARPGMVVGIPVTVAVGTFELYYVLPIDHEAASADLVRNTVIITGIALVVLLAVMAGLITRLVVNPVRDAARTAQRLSAGLLDQRMAVRGEDDLAMLAASFNQMAVNLQRQIVRLEDRSRLQRRFTSDVSHELRTPLTTVRMAADLLYTSRDDLDPLMSRSAELLNAELDRFEELLTDLLEISRFDAGFAALDAEPTDLVAVLDRVVDRLASVAERAEISIRLIAPDHPVIAEVDPRRVERVLRNLVGNAIEHGEGQPVVVTLYSDESAAAVTVRDFGVGLKPGEEKLVFNRFWRADPSRARQTGGTGLGLSISLEDARLHGGWLEAWGEPGRGAQFRLVLPLRAGGRLNSAPLPLVPESNELPMATTDVVLRRAEPADSETPAHDVGGLADGDQINSNGHPGDNVRPAATSKAAGSDPQSGSGQPTVDADESSSEAAHA
jgi:two-component system sensor histidine kinase MtrB